jgi:hypothetical protein
MTKTGFEALEKDRKKAVAEPVKEMVLPNLDRVGAGKILSKGGHFKLSA